MKYVFFIVIFLLGMCLHAQQAYIKTSIYYNTDSFNLTSDHQKRLDKIADTLKKLDVQEILLRGNTDADADSLYNIRLSAKRVTAVKSYLAIKGIDISKVKLDYYGENKPIAENETDVGKQKNRRVDIIIRALYMKVVVPIEPKKRPPKIIPDTLYQPTPTTVVEAIDTCTKDTTITLPQGSIITMSLCDYITQMECGGLKLDEFVSPQSVRDSSINTMDNHGNVLVSGGMLNIKTCNDSCLIKPITIRLLIIETCPAPCAMSVWIQRDSWRPLDTALKIVKIDGKKYYEVKLICPGRFNMDCKPKYRDITIKLPRRYKPIEISVSNDCPMWVFSNIITSPKRKQQITIPCQLTQNLKENTVYVKALNPNGDTVILNYKKISQLKLRNEFFVPKNKPNKGGKITCNRPWLIFGRKKSKVKIRKKDFDIIIPTKNTP